LERELLPHDLRLHRARALHPNGPRSLPARSARRVSHVLHPHRSGVAEFTHFIFPILKPDVQPMVAASVHAVVGRRQLMEHLPNFWVHVTGRYYFPGMYTAILPMIPGIYGIRKLLAGARLAGVGSVANINA